AGVLWVAVESYRTCQTSQPRGKLNQLAAWDVVHGQLAFFERESLLILPVPADGDPVAAQDGAFVRREKAVVLLIRPVGAVPKVCRLAVAVANKVKAVEDTAVRWGLDVGLFRQSVGEGPVG